MLGKILSRGKHVMWQTHKRSTIPCGAMPYRMHFPTLRSHGTMCHFLYYKGFWYLLVARRHTERETYLSASLLDIESTPSPFLPSTTMSRFFTHASKLFTIREFHSWARFGVLGGLWMYFLKYEIQFLSLNPKFARVLVAHGHDEQHA